MNSIGVVIVDRGAAVVTVERDQANELLCTNIERLPFDLAAVSGRVQSVDTDTRVVIDAEGLGSALWGVLGRPAKDRRFTLYAGRGVERQALVDELLVAVQEGRFHFAPDLAEQPAMSKALVSYRREVKADGFIGSELVVALLLAITPPPKPRPKLYVGIVSGDPFANRPGIRLDGSTDVRSGGWIDLPAYLRGRNQ